MKVCAAGFRLASACLVITGTVTQSYLARLAACYVSRVEARLLCGFTCCQQTLVNFSLATNNIERLNPRQRLVARDGRLTAGVDGAGTELTGMAAVEHRCAIGLRLARSLYTAR